MSAAPREVTLRPVDPADLDAFFEWQRDPQTVEMIGLPPRDRAAFDAHWERTERQPDVVRRTVLADGAVAGNVLSFERGGERFVGYVLDRSQWGRGIATRALREFLEELPRPLVAEVEAHNRGSRRVLEKCGFTYAGRVTGQVAIDLLRFELPR